MKQEHSSGQSKRENRDSLVLMRRIDMSPYMPISFNIGSSGGRVYAISNSNVSDSLSLSLATRWPRCGAASSGYPASWRMRHWKLLQRLQASRFEIFWKELRLTQTLTFLQKRVLPARSKVENATFRAERLWRWRWEGIAWHLHASHNLVKLVKLASCFKMSNGLVAWLVWSNWQSSGEV